jgi:hypothetical protein
MGGDAARSPRRPRHDSRLEQCTGRHRAAGT